MRKISSIVIPFLAILLTSCQQKSDQNNQAIESEEVMASSIINEDSIIQKLAFVISNLTSMDVQQIDSVTADCVNEQFIAEVDTMQLERASSDQYYAANVQYSRDTFFLRATYDLMLKANPTPTGMMIANDYRRTKTDELINSYYQKLLAAIKSKFKYKAEENQSLWEKSQTSDIDFSNFILSKEYTGDYPGTRVLYTDYTSANSRLDFLFSCWMEVRHVEE